MRRLSLLLTLACLPVRSAVPHCGTILWMQRHGDAAHFLDHWAAKRAAASLRTSGVVPNRTLETDHFVIHYSLRGIHRIKLTPDDAALARILDSLYRSLPANDTGLAADAEVIGKLDAMGAPHPIYADTMAGYFERARAYYVDHLGMHAPVSTGPSHFFGAPLNPQGKYAVDVVDIGTAEPDFQGMVYALTFPASQGGMLMENDFLFNSRLDPSGTFPLGDSIKSQYQGKVLYNYGAQWAAGLKVTCFHEFYHSVQFTYVPILDARHVWYETAATGMEQRNAPEVTDYLQYMPDLFADLPQRSMFDYVNSDKLSEYGNGIFHFFLSHYLAEDFDVRVWSRLAVNNNNLQEALAFVFAAYGKTSREVYAHYAEHLAFAGTQAKDPLAAFSPYTPIWPRLQLTNLDLKTTTNYSLNLSPPFSLKALRISGAAHTGSALVLADTSFAPVLARITADTGTAVFPSANPVDLDQPDDPGTENIVLAPNGSLDKYSRADIERVISPLDTVVYAYPNPVLAGAAGSVHFSRLARAASVQVFGEDGRAVKRMTFSPDTLLWSWNFTDAGGKPVASGVYYYQVDALPLQTLYLGP